MEVEVVRLGFRASGVDPHALAPQGGRICPATTVFLATLLHLALGLGEASCWSCAELPVPCPRGLGGSLKLICSWLGQMQGMLDDSASFMSAACGDFCSSCVLISTQAWGGEGAL